MNKSERLTIKLYPSDKALLARVAAAEGESVAVIVRRLVRRAARIGLRSTEDEGPMTKEAETNGE